MNRTLLILLALPFFAFSQTEKGVIPINPKSKIQNPKSVRAVIIGISNYQDEKIPDLRFADRDAEAFAAFLQSPAGGSLPAENLKLLTNQSATTGAMAAAMDWLIAECQPGERAIIYFSGHGDVETRTRFQRGFLLTHDSPPTNYLAGAFALIFLQDIITTLSERGVQVVMVSDACRAGKLAGSAVGGTQATAANLALQFANEVKVLSCQADEFSLEGEQWGGGRGAFSFNLIEGLTGLADADASGQVSLLELNRFLEDAVPKQTAPQVQIPMTIGGKATVMATVDATSLANLRASKKAEPALISAIETKGFEESILAATDTFWKEKYRLFEISLKKGELLAPAQPNAHDLFQELAARPELEKLRGVMLRNLVAALQEESQQAVNAYLRADEAEAAARSRGDLRYTKYVRYLEKAAELLGPSHYMYKSLRAKQHYFNAVDIRVRFSGRTFSLGDSVKIWEQASRESIQKAYELEPNAAFILNEMYIAHKGPERLGYLQKALEIAPEWAILYGNLARVALSDNQFERSDSLARKALALAPGFVSSFYLLGWACGAQKKFAEAEAFFKQAVVLSPQNVDAKKVLANFYFSQKRYIEAEKLMLEGLALSPNDNELHNQLSEIYLRTSQFEKGAAINLQRLKMRPTDGDAFSDLLVNYNMLGQSDKIPALVEEMKRLDAAIKNWEGTAMLGKQLFQMGQHEEGLAIQKRAIRAAPGAPWGHYLIAGSYHSMGDFEKMLAHLDTAFEKNIDGWWVEQFSEVPSAVAAPIYRDFAQKRIDKQPKWGYGHSLMGVYFDEKKDWATARQFHQKAVALSPDGALNWYHYAQSAHKSGQPELADSLFQKYLVLVFVGSLADNLIRVGYFYYANDDFDRASRFFKKAIEKEPVGLNWFHYAQSAHKSGQPELADSLFQKYLDLAGGTADNLNRVGYFYNSNSDFDRAGRFFKKAFEKEPATEANYHYNMACLESLRGQPKRAFKFLEKAVKSGQIQHERLVHDPDFEPIRGLPEWTVFLKKYFPVKQKTEN